MRTYIVPFDRAPNDALSSNHDKPGQTGCRALSDTKSTLCDNVRIRCVWRVSSAQRVVRDSGLGGEIRLVPFGNTESRSQSLEILHVLTRTLTTRLKPVR